MHPAGAKARYTPEEYLALGEQAESKSKYHNGKIIHIVEDSFNHNRIITSLCTYLLEALQGNNYEPFSRPLA